MAELTLNVGDTAPNFSIPDQHGNNVSLQDFPGKWVVLYFYPKDDTPGCTTEAIDFTAQLATFQKGNAVILGVSRDSCESHQAFIQKKELKITLLSDPERTVLEKYGVWQLKKNYGKEYWGIARSTFLIDPLGKIAHIWSSVKATGHAAKVAEKLSEIQAGATA